MVCVAVLVTHCTVFAVLTKGLCLHPHPWPWEEDLRRVGLACPVPPTSEQPSELLVILTMWSDLLGNGA